MTTVRLTCPCGHAWEHPRTEPIPANLREICPECAISSQNTLEPSSHSSQNPLSQGSKSKSPAATGSSASPATASTPSPTSGPSGRIVAGFELLEEINRGGMGVIYRARQIAMKRIVALKAITPSKLEIPGARARFMAEVHASARLNHQNIVQVYATDLDGPFPYLVMEYVPGIDLLRLVRKSGPLPVPDAVYYIRQATEGLQHAFEQGLVHRDIKPSNLIVTPAPIGSPELKTGKLPRVKILDMGLARVVTPEERDTEMDLTQAGVFLGTPDYVSPEQAEDATQADIRSDIYSLGGSLYFLLTGEVPFPGKTLVEKIRRALTDPPPSASAKRKDVTPAINAVIRKMMARNPEARYQTPAETMAALDRAMRGESIAASESSAAEVKLDETTTPQVQVKAHAGAVRGLALANLAEGTVLVSAGDDSKLRLWQLSSLQEVKTIIGDLGAVEQLAIAPNGKRAATCAIRLTTTEMGVQLWELATGAEKRLHGPANNIRCVAIAPDSRSIAAGADDSMVWVWSLEQGSLKSFCMKGHVGPVRGVYFVSAESLLTAGDDGAVKQWELRKGKMKGSLPAGVGPIVAMAYGGKRVAVAGNSLAVRMSTGQFARLDGHDGPVLSCAFSPDGRLLVSGGTDKTVRVWSAEEATALATYSGHGGAVRAVAFDPSGKALFSGGDDGMLLRWPAPLV